MTERFFDKLERLCREKRSLLCVGLDPRMGGEGEVGTEEIVRRNRLVIAETAPYTVCYKPNIAFYEASGLPGLMALEETLNLIPEDIPVILDAKRNDIGQTAWAYAKSLFERYHAEAVTLNPYMGKESVLPFLEYKGKGLLMLCRTSNPGADSIQNLLVCGRAKTGIKGEVGRTSLNAYGINTSPGHSGVAYPKEETSVRTNITGSNTHPEPEPLYLRLASEVLNWGEDIGLIIGATVPEALEAVRQEHPHAWILCPGIGAQGGSLEKAVSAGIREDGCGLICVVGRDIYGNPEPGRKALEYRELINRVRGQKQREGVVSSYKQPLGLSKKEKLLKALIDHGSLKFGSFKLKSGEMSPYYLDLRKIISSPTLLYNVAEAYCTILEDLEFERIAAVPMAALPIATAVSLQMNVPLIYPRLSLKDHGTGNNIEGDFIAGETVILLDDVLSSAHSKLEALKVLKEAGLKVRDLVVLVDRESGGVEKLKDEGIKLHSFARITEMLKLFSAERRGENTAQQFAQPFRI